LSLQDRKEAFSLLASRFENTKVSDLLLEHKIPNSLKKWLHSSVFIYVSKCLPGDELYLDENSLMNALVENYDKDKIPNMTPNGMLVPKKYLVLEYNQLVRSFAAIIDSLNIRDLISSWHIPLNLRFKAGEVNESNMVRHHPTEHIHSDSWAGESSESVTIQIPIFGDIKNNHVSFYDPPDDFEESWLGPRSSYEDGSDIANRYSKVNFVPNKGHLQFSDFAGLHASTRLPNAGPRLSIDTTFVIKKPNDNRSPETIHKWREGERAMPNLLSNLGSDSLLYFPHGMNEFVDSEGGFKHPSNLKVIDLVNS
tara:strand:+ start:260 stop:1189 length:930 start_codon:yes stop_codon:yes gene_type:complete